MREHTVQNREGEGRPVWEEESETCDQDTPPEFTVVGRAIYEDFCVVSPIISKRPACVSSQFLIHVLGGVQMTHGSRWHVQHV